jgi:valyl-tRNA synthetase
MGPKIEAKSWNPSLEQSIFKIWEDNNLYVFSNTFTEKKPFVIDTPPPYPSGRPWHIGAAAHYAQIDMIARTARMKGYNVMFPIGIDRNGLPVEIYTEKKYKIQMRKMDRAKFLELCSHTLDDLEEEMILIMKSMGMSCNFKDYYRTDSNEFRTLTQSTFIDLWKQGLIYIANRPNNYCPDCGTTIADQEIVYKDIPTKLVYINFMLKTSDNRTITIATTRPELLFACQAVIVNPQDERYKELQGKTAILPLFSREVPIMPHRSVKPEFGSGAVMVCSYGDQNDVNLFRELRLQEIVAFNENGLTTLEAGPYSNLNAQKARTRIIENLKKAGVVEKEENILHRTPLCERSMNPIEIIPLQDYYLKQLEYIPQLKKLAMQLNFHPLMHRQILLNWLDSVAIDWPISRRRFYGTEIPIWYCNNCKTPNLPEAGKYYRPWKENPPFQRCHKCSSTEFTGEDRTFDTWMDSSITPLFITKYGRDKSVHCRLYPTQIRPQAKDIIRTWLYYTILRCFQLTDKLAWSDAWIMGYGADEKGEKMSKSKGNVIDPYPIVHHYGADTMRFWSASEANLGYDFRCSEQRIAGAKNFLSKLWNIGRFLSAFEVISDMPEQKLAMSDRWILAELSKLVIICNKGYDDFNFFIPANAIRDFTWNLFAAHYIELVKGRVYDLKNETGQYSATFALHRCYSTILLLLAPVCPFITEKLWTTIYSHGTIHLQELPSAEHYYHLENDPTRYTRPITDFNSMVWNKKKETISKDTGKPLSLKDSISVSIPVELQVFEEDLRAMHNIEK